MASTKEGNLAHDTLVSSMRKLAAGDYKAAANGASDVLAIDPSNFDASITLSQALLHLRAFKDALSSLENVESDPRAEESLKIARRCYEEHQSGKYDIAEMTREALKSGRIMHGDYAIPDVGLRYLDNTKIRGLFALKDLKRGTLLFAEKAFVSVFPGDTPVRMPDNEYKKLRPPRPTDAPELVELVQKAMYTIFHKKLGWQLFNLHDPTRENLEKINGTTYDDYDPDSIDVPLQWNYKDDTDDWFTNCNILSCLRVENTVRASEFSMDGVILPGFLKRHKQLTRTGLAFASSNRVNPRGLFYGLGLLNHACISNCDQFYIGDMAFLCTSTDIPAGTELTLSYWSNLHSLSKRLDNANGYCLTCRCSLCKYQLQNAQKTKVAEMFVNKVKKQKLFTNIDFSRMLDSLKKVYGFECQIKVPVLQYHETRTAMISGDPTQEQLVSYLSATMDMYETFVSMMLDANQYQHAAHYRAECYMIGVHAKVQCGTLLMWALEVAVLCMFDQSGEINEATKAAWMRETRKCMQELYHSEDERIWEALLAPIFKDISKLRK